MGDFYYKNLEAKTGRLERVISGSKLMLFSVGIVSTFILFKVATIPFTFSFIFSLFSFLPKLWIFFRICLSPPYIYILLNFIIISIAASSTSAPQNRPQPEEKVTKKVVSENNSSLGKTQNFKKSANDPQQQQQPHDDDLRSFVTPHHVDDDEEVKEENPTLSTLKLAEPSQETASNAASVEDFTKKSGEFALETLEDAWRLITEDWRKPQNRHMKKSETWDTPPLAAVNVAKERKTGGEHGEHCPDSEGDNGSDNPKDHVAWAKRDPRKSETFNDRASLRREKSMSQDDLNRKADAFIKKFNTDTRLQRLESHQRQMAMVKRNV